MNVLIKEGKGVKVSSFDGVVAITNKLKQFSHFAENGVEARGRVVLDCGGCGSPPAGVGLLADFGMLF